MRGTTALGVRARRAHGRRRERVRTHCVALGSPAEAASRGARGADASLGHAHTSRAGLSTAAHGGDAVTPIFPKKTKCITICMPGSVFIYIVTYK
jgi:hypothetical protein